MFNTYEFDKTLIFKFASKHCFVSDAVLISKRYLAKLDFPEHDLIDIGLLLRELLINALEHGNKKNVEKQIYCIIESSEEDQLKIMVSDEGDGFNYRAVNMLFTEDTLSNQYRGYPLINSIADRLEFNEKGNCITAYLTVLMEKDELCSNLNNHFKYLKNLKL